MLIRKSASFPRGATAVMVSLSTTVGLPRSRSTAHILRPAARNGSMKWLIRSGAIRSDQERSGRPPGNRWQGASFSSAVDTTARIMAGLSLVVALISISVTYVLWFRSGARLTVTAFVRAETASIHIEVSSKGRLTATLRQVELRDYFVLRGTAVMGTGPITTNPVSRWSIPVAVHRAGVAQTLPIDLAPTAFVEGDVDVREVLAKQAGASEINVYAWAQRGDLEWYASRPVRVK